MSLLNGLIHCGKCGHRMVTSGTKGQRTYRCPNRPGMPGCGSVSGYAAPIEEVVESYAQRRLADSRVRESIVRLSTRATPELLAEIGSIEDRIRELEASLEEPGVPVATILRALDRSREKLEECQRQLNAATPIQIPANVGEWPTDLERRRRLVELVVGNVRLNPTAPGWSPRHGFDRERVKIDRA